MQGCCYTVARSGCSAPYLPKRLALLGMFGLLKLPILPILACLSCPHQLSFPFPPVTTVVGRSDFVLGSTFSRRKRHVSVLNIFPIHTYCWVLLDFGLFYALPFLSCSYSLYDQYWICECLPQSTSHSFVEAVVISSESWMLGAASFPSHQTMSATSSPTHLAFPAYNEKVGTQ